MSLLIFGAAGRARQRRWCHAGESRIGKRNLVYETVDGECEVWVGFGKSTVFLEPFHMAGSPRIFHETLFSGFPKGIYINVG